MPYGAALRLTDYERTPIEPLWPTIQAITWAS